MTFGEGAVQSGSLKQKISTRSSTASELVGCDDGITKILWTRLFVEAQGYRITENILYQDNKSTILLVENGRKSAGKRSCALNIWYFFIADQQAKGYVNVKYFSTKQMWADPLTKPLQGSEFKIGADCLMGRTKVWFCFINMWRQGYVGWSRVFTSYELWIFPENCQFVIDLWIEFFTQFSPHILNKIAHFSYNM